MTRRVSVWLMVGLALGGAGCHSIYHRTRAKLPLAPCAQLELRLEEARRAEAFAQTAGARLRARLELGLAGAAVQADLDRFEAAALELERRVACAREAAARCPTRPDLAAELERLQQRSQQMLAGLEPARRAGPSANASAPDDALRGSARP